MSTPISSLLSTKQQLLEKEAECRRMSTLASLTHGRQMEFGRLADHWAQLAKAETQ